MRTFRPGRAAAGALVAITLTLGALIIAQSIPGGFEGFWGS